MEQGCFTLFNLLIYLLSLNFGYFEDKFWRLNLSHGKTITKEPISILAEPNALALEMIMIPKNISI